VLPKAHPAELRHRTRCVILKTDVSVSDPRYEHIPDFCTQLARVHRVLMMWDGGGQG
jgi:hypothetical protein